VIDSKYYNQKNINDMFTSVGSGGDSVPIVESDTTGLADNGRAYGNYEEMLTKDDYAN